VIIYGTCVGDPERYESIALPSLRRVASAEDLIVRRTGELGICAAYNGLIQEARGRPDCAALVLIHDDVEIVDDDFRVKVLESLAEPEVGVIGVIGGAGLRDAAWWTARRTAGFIYETRGPIRKGPNRADVDVVDGLLLAVAPSAFRKLLFDQGSFPAFHGYEADYCLQVRAAGMRVVVRDLAVLHRTKTGFGDKKSWKAASRTISRKWRGYFPRFNSLSRLVARLRGAVRYRKKVLRARLIELRDRLRGQGTTQANPSVPVMAQGNPTCPVCRKEVPIIPTDGQARGITDCPTCGTGITWPPPSRDATSSAIFDGCFGGTRLARRQVWLSEARERLDWVKLYVPCGVLLEVGCATGEFLSVARDDGYECYGVETSDWAAKHARISGAQVVTGYLEDWASQHPGVRVDAVLLWHVLEHIPAPLEFLRVAQSVLKPGGRLIIEVPNYGCSAARIKGRDWRGASLVEHYYHYRPESLGQMLGDGGFDVSYLLEFSERIYSSSERWERLTNQALLDRVPWPSLEFIRMVAVHDTD
jgi:GT2 family glycosyltransferase/SAM-dependent methyltransferase